MSYALLVLPIAALMTSAIAFVSQVAHEFADLSPVEWIVSAALTAFVIAATVLDRRTTNERTPDEAIPEEKVSRQRVDWAFRLRSIPRFFLECKRPGVNLDDPGPAKQAIKRLAEITTILNRLRQHPGAGPVAPGTVVV